MEFGTRCYQAFIKALSVTLENKGIYAGFIGLAFSIIWSVFTYLVPSLSGVNEDIQGIWLQGYSYSDGDGHYKLIGTTEYFDNDSYNFTGEVELNYFDEGQSIGLSYNIDLSGEWQERDELLTMKVIELKSFPIKVTLNS